MANEAVLKIETHIPINYTCSTEVTIEKGAIVKNTTPMTAVLSNGANDIVAGIVKTEKLAAETTMNSVAVYRGGVFRVKCSGSLSAGDPVVTQGNENVVIVAGSNNENVLGIMLEDASEGESKLMELRPTTMQLA